MDSPLPSHTVALIRARSLCAEKTIVRWWRGENVRDASRFRIEEAARALGITLKEGPHAA